MLRGWLSWAIAAIFVLYLFLLQASTSVMIPQLMHDFSIDVAGVGLLSASYFYTYIVLQMPAGCLVGRLGARKILVSSFIGCAFLCWIFATTHSFVIAQLSRCLLGVTTASGVVSAFYLAGNWFPQRFALFAGLTEMLGMLGGALGQALLALGVKYLGWRGTVEVCAMVGVVLAVLALLIVRNFPSNHRVIHEEQQQHSFLQELWQVFKLPQAWVYGIFAGFVFAILTGFAALWSVPFLIERYSVALTTAATASSMVFWGAAMGGPLIGYIANIFFSTRNFLLGWVSALLFIFGLIVYCPVIPLGLMFVLLFCLGFASSAYVLAFALTEGHVDKSLRSTAMGFTNMVCIIFGAPIMQPLIGWLLKLGQPAVQHISEYNLSDYQRAFFILFVGLIIALISICFISRSRN